MGNESKECQGQFQICTCRDILTEVQMMHDPRNEQRHGFGGACEFWETVDLDGVESSCSNDKLNPYMKEPEWQLHNRQ
jgi:hypothetical protein